MMATNDSDNPPGPDHPKEVTITLLKAEPAKSREQWWRMPLKGLENRRPPAAAATKPADPEMVRKAIEAIKAKQAAGGGGTKLSAKPGAVAAATNGTAARAAPSAPGRAAPVKVPAATAAAAAPSAAAGTSPGAAAGASARGGEGDAATAGEQASGAKATPPPKTGKTGGKKKNRKKK